MRTGWHGGALIFGLLPGLLLVPRAASAQHAGAAVVIREPVAGNLYLAGGTVDVRGEVEKDLVAAGGTITVERRVKGDVIVAGGAVDLRAPVLDDVRAAGGMVTVEGDVGGDLIVAGGRIDLTPATRVGGRTWLSGGSVHVAGRLDRELKVAARRIVVSGQVDGDVRLVGKDIAVRPSARIRGTLTYTSPYEAKIAPGAQIGGGVTRARSELVEGAPLASRVAAALLRLAMLLGLIVAGCVLVLLFPDFTASAAETIRSDPWKSLGLGVALLVAAPVAAVLLLITVVGIPLGLTVLALYGVALLVAYLVTAFFLGDLAGRLRRRERSSSHGRQIRLLIAALIGLGLLELIPTTGAISALLALVFGLGASTTRAYRAYAGGIRGAP